MAILTNDDYRRIGKIVRSDPTAKAELKGWGLNKATWKALFQAAEDWFVDGFTVQPPRSFKAELELVTGPCTLAQAKQTGYAWMGWRYAVNP